MCMEKMINLLNANLFDKKSRHRKESDPQRRSELDVLLEEYKVLRNEVVSLQDYSKQAMTTTFAGVGVLTVVTPTIIESKLNILLLIFPFFFYGLTLISVKYAIAGINIGNYIKTILASHIEDLLKEEDRSKDYSHVFLWEKTPGIVRKYGLLFLPAFGASYWIPLLAASLCIAVYFFATTPPFFSYWVQVLLALNVIFFAYTCIVGLRTAFLR